MDFADRVKKLKPFYVMELLETAREMESRGEDIVHMEIGEPDFPTPRPVKEAAIRAIGEDHTFYTQSLGLPSLKERIAEFYRTNDSITIPPGRIIITSGTSGAFLLLSAVLLEKGKTIAVSDPGYPCYRNFGLLFDANVDQIPVSEEGLFEIDAEQLERLGTDPRLLIIANPSNPTGMIYRDDKLRELYQSLSRKGGHLVVDEIYRGLVYGERPRTALSLSDDVIVIDGFSKVYAMTGWRLGWMVVPEELVRPIQTVAQNVFISPPTVSQHSALAAFDAAEEVDMMKATYRERRDFLLPELRRLGFRIDVEPVGAFYIYAGIENWGMDSRVFAERALREAKVAITHGYDFGDHGAGNHVRFSYATGIERLREACARLERWLKTVH